MQDERARLEAADAHVEGDQLLEGAALVKLGVVAPDHDVRDMGEAAGAQEVPVGCVNPSVRMLRRIRG
jgi:hypothetical protein